MGGLAHLIEAQGIATTQISLIREHTVKIKPPRALWVPFPLGRPLGNPNAPEFQKDVLKEAFALLDYSTGPVLLDYPHDADHIDEGDEPPACPVSFVLNPEDLTDRERFLQGLQAEINTIMTWHSVALEGNRRTTAGLSGLALDEIVDFFTAFIEGSPVTPPADIGLADFLRTAAEDLKACYFEAISAQPGQSSDPGVLAEWFWSQTHAARLLGEVRTTCLHYDSRDMQLAGKLLLIPRDQLHRFEE